MRIRIKLRASATHRARALVTILFRLCNLHASARDLRHLSRRYTLVGGQVKHTSDTNPTTCYPLRKVVETALPLAPAEMACTTRSDVLQPDVGVQHWFPRH